MDKVLAGYNQLIGSYNLVRQSLPAPEARQMFRLAMEYLLHHPLLWTSAWIDGVNRENVRSKLYEMDKMGIPWARDYYLVLFGMEVPV